MSKRAIARHFCISRDSVDSSEDQGLIQWINPPTDDRVLRAAGLPADGADQAAEAGRVHRDHRRVAARGRRPSSQAASHREAGPGSPAGGARVHRRLHHREGLLARAPAAQPGDVRAAAPRSRPRPGGLRRGDGRHRRGRAEDALFVLDLPHSDACYVRAYPAATAEAWADGHVHAFAFFGCVPVSVLYDSSSADAETGGSLTRHYRCMDP